MKRARSVGAVAALTLIWLLLWGRWSAGTVIGGVLVSVAVRRGARLPSGSGLGRLHPGFALVALADVARELVVSGLTVAVHVIRHPRDAAAAVVAVPVRAESEAETALAAGVVSLTPGTLVVGLDAERRLLLVHCMPVHHRTEAERLRRQVAETERRWDRAFGERHESGPST